MPEDGRLQAWLAVKEETWDKQTDGVLFRIGISDGREYEELVNQHVDPGNNPSDRRWVPIDVDLSAYAGQAVEADLQHQHQPQGAATTRRSTGPSSGALGSTDRRR